MFSCRTLTLIFSVSICLNCATGASAQSDDLSLHSLFGANELSDNVSTVRRHATALPLSERYEYLKTWVLPSESHPDFRVVGEFSPTDPSPFARQLQPHLFRSEQGGELVSPVFDLLQAANRTGKLTDLSSALDRLPDPIDSVQWRSKLVLQLLLALEMRDTKTLDRLAPKLFSLTSATFKRRGVNYWPEMHLMSWAIDHRSSYRLVGTLLSDLYIQRSSIGMRDLWKSHILAWMGRYENHLDERRRGSEVHSEIPDGWIPVTRANSKSRGEGFPPLRWKMGEFPELILHSGHDDDYLMFRSPLSGNFQVESEMDQAGSSQIQLLGRFIGPKSVGKWVASGSFGQGEQKLEIEVPKTKRDKTVRYRGVVQDTEVWVFLNGELITGYALEKNHEPWLALRSGGTSRGNFHNVQITGEPVIPEFVEMSDSNTLSDWVPYYLFTESAGTNQSDWMRQTGENDQERIVGRRGEAPPGSSFESLLRYQRPLVEDGTIEYEFWYRPGEYIAHPALDRLVFLIRPDGVRIHWLTDGKYDPTEVPPDNVIDEPENRRGPENLPLNLNDWNRMKITTAGDTVTLDLNGTLIYERTLEPTNARTFGLFHYADREELLVRDAVMRGDWPRSLPSLAEQQLSDPLLSVIDKDLDHLKAEFKHDFAKDGLPEQYFKYFGQDAALKFTQRPDGVYAQLTPYGQWNTLGVTPHFGLQGDFDIEFEFAQLQLNEIMTRGEILLQLVLDDEETHWLRSARGLQENSDQYFNGGVSSLDNSEKRRFSGARTGETSDSGRLRIARRGTDLYTMFAEGDSTIFQIIKHENVPEADVKMHGIEIKQFLKDSGTVSVVWKNLSIRAEKMTYLAGGKKRSRKLFAMSPDGKNLRPLAEPKFGLNHLGSPEFSADGSLIVMDMATGSTTTSHVVIMNRDGSDMKDLGMGCMPSLSRDGKSIVFSDPRAGIVKMDADGENRKTIDRSGWGVQYSPDGKQIAYGSGTTLTLIDPKTEEKTPLLEGELANRYSRIYWNFGWSHDSQAIAFKGHAAATGQQELAVVDINQPDKVELLYSGNGIYEDFTFSPDNQSVLFALRKEGPSQPDLYLAHREKPGQIERLEGQPDDYKILDCDWSPDGKDIVFAALVDPVPVDWPLQAESRTGQ